jgi:hypothetical protein
MVVARFSFICFISAFQHFFHLVVVGGIDTVIHRFCLPFPVVA